ncbi:MAG TPA: hypothetical protein VFQ38_14040 [Longimicrobiales bacterium]|nr:hypothetical protein [Longimicrobiales bacterium]
MNASNGNAAPPEPSPPEGRAFIHAGRPWIARLAGGGMAGTGRVGFGLIEAVHFFRDGAERPSFEALIPRGRFHELFDHELSQLLREARPIAAPDTRRA